MHMQERVNSDVGKQSWEQSPLLTLQGLVPSCSGGGGRRQREKISGSPWDLSAGLCCPGTGWSPPLWWSLPNPALRSPVLLAPGPVTRGALSL